MIRLHPERTLDDQVDYHLADGRAPIFEEQQPGRIRRCRAMLDVASASLDYPLTIWEPGCGAADISGPKSFLHTVYGCDVTDEAERIVALRFPMMHFMKLRLEEIEPQPCDVLVLCELLEHIEDPVGLVERWAPLAKRVLIGHPLAPPGTDPEPGHIWSYEMEDFNDWFRIGGHAQRDVETFPMNGYERMVLGWGERR